MVRTFYTHRSTPTSDVMIWYADREFGFYETLPKRVADMHATHVTIEVRNQRPSVPVPSRISNLYTRSVSEKLGYLP